MAVIFQDTFTEAGTSTTDLHLHTPDTGTAWTNESLSIAGARFLVEQSTDNLRPAANPGSGYSLYSCTPAPTSAEYDVSIDVPVYTGTSTCPIHLIGRFTNTSNYYGLAVYRNADSPNIIIYKIVGGTATSLATANATLADGDTIKFEIRDATKKAYVNGVEVASTTDNALTSAGKAGLGNGALFNASDDGSNAWDLDNFIVDEVAGGGAYTLTADPGSISLTGTAATLRVARLLTAGGGSYTLAGTDAALKAARTILAAGGSFTVTGSDATLTYDPADGTLNAEPGAFTISAPAGTLVASRLLTAEAGSFTISGTAATMTAAQVLQAGGGVYLITGSAATLDYSGAEEILHIPSLTLLGVG